jgi:membrane fusion protein, copper/silver efflux system
MNIKRLFNNRFSINSLLLLTGLFIGWLVFHHPGGKEVPVEKHSESAVENIWTCSMHPHIRMDHPGKCPICGMDLIPLGKGKTHTGHQDAVQMTPEAIQLAGVRTSVVSRQVPVKELRLYGTVQPDERLLQAQVAHFPGRIEHLSVNFTGEHISPGQILGQLYSPELISAQQELIESAKNRFAQPEIFEAAKEKLRQWKLTDAQITQIAGSGNIQNIVNIISGTKGVVISKRVNSGDYVSQGTVLYDIADLSKVWIIFDAYETDLQFLRTGQKISFTLQALPGKVFPAEIIFIDPVIDPVTRVARVRAEADNSSGSLKPGMFARGKVASVNKDYTGRLVIPSSSVLWTGKRSVVYVKQQGDSGISYTLREIELGPMLDDSYIVTSGLNENEEIVTRGTFYVDAAAQLEGKPSMMNIQNRRSDTDPSPDEMQ